MSGPCIGLIGVGNMGAPMALRMPERGARLIVCDRRPEAVAPLQMLTLTLTPPSEPGMFDEEFAIVVEGRPQPVTFKVKGRIVPPEITGTK